MDVNSKTINALQNLPFENIIGGPLDACVKAQALAAKSTVDFIKEVGLDESNGKKEVVYVYFEFIQNGRRVVISVPLLTIVPIPYIAINTIDISFKATISGTQSTSDEDTYSTQTNTQKNQKKAARWWSRNSASMNTTISTKRDSKSTQESNYSIEATIDVNVHASQDSMPAGMAKVLEMLGAALDLCSPDGELSVSDTILIAEGTGDNATARLAAQYKTPEGLYDPTAIKVGTIVATSANLTEDTAYFDLEAGTYTVTAGNKTISVKVEAPAS